MSAGKYTPATCPKCKGPFAYGSAAVTVNFALLMVFKLKKLLNAKIIKEKQVRNSKN